MDIFSMLKNMDKDTLEKSISAAQAFLSTPEGKNAAQMLSEGKMPDGSKVPDELKSAASAISDNKEAQNMLGEFLKKGRRTP
ncbi:MAG: hypothetical protein IJ297_07965 [Clostridia bacterium]|nr:hypothetical protein [Clostridia bacterium]